MTETQVKEIMDIIRKMKSENDKFNKANTELEKEIEAIKANNEILKNNINSIKVK